MNNKIEGFTAHCPKGRRRTTNNRQRKSKEYKISQLVEAGLQKMKL